MISYEHVMSTQIFNFNFELLSSKIKQTERHNVVINQ